ncbi:hypothetical protein DPMN_021832 [Dreissena polymorpha]|uniref:Uncharacterized protein n=1 Tax=Dreissena polymorpha TaxID=45954 RepID=A0A9D4NPJ0_DREPO|nr:hypothetical protein DPMN_021832 [Dreissena polymorpha]
MAHNAQRTTDKKQSQKITMSTFCSETFEGLAGGTWTSAFGETLTEYGGGTSKHDRNRQGNLDGSQCLDLILAAGGTWKAAGETGKAGAGITRKTAPPPWQPYIYKTNLFTNHVILLTRTIFQLNSGIKETNVLTKFHENWAKNVTSKVFTCFHYIHIKKNATPTGGHVFTPIWTIFELVQHINKTNRKTAPPTGGHLHEDWALNVTSTVFKLDRDIIQNLLAKFHEDRTINVASRVLTNKCGRTEGQRTKTSHKSSPEQSDGRTDDGQRPVKKAHLGNQAGRQANRQTDRQTDRQAKTIYNIIII